MLVADLQVAVDIPQLYVVTYDLKTVPTFILKAWGFECEHIRIGIFQYIWCNNFYKSICRATQLHRDQIGCEVSSMIQMEKKYRDGICGIYRSGHKMCLHFPQSFS